MYAVGGTLSGDEINLECPACSWKETLRRPAPVVDVKPVLVMPWPPVVLLGLALWVVIVGGVVVHFWGWGGLVGHLFLSN